MKVGPIFLIGSEKLSYVTCKCISLHVRVKTNTVDNFAFLFVGKAGWTFIRLSDGSNIKVANLF